MRKHSGISIDEIHPYELMVSMKAAHRGWYVRCQSIYSKIILVLIAVVVAAPILLVAGILIKMTSLRPAITGKARYGPHGKTFSNV